MSNGYFRPGGFGGFSYFPPIIKNLLIANVAVFFVQYFVLGGSFHAKELILKYFALQPVLTDSAGYPDHFYIWQVVTYQFLHGGFSHIFFNMLALWMFGMEIENTWGARKFLIFYLLCGIGGAVLQLVLGYFLYGGSNTTIGASGAIYGVMIAFALMFPDRYIFIYFMLPIKAKYLVPGLILLEVMAVDNQFSGVAHLVHIGGALTAFIFMLLDKDIQFALKDKLKGRSNFHSDVHHYSGYDDYKRNKEQYYGTKPPQSGSRYGNSSGEHSRDAGPGMDGNSGDGYQRGSDEAQFRDLRPLDKPTQEEIDRILDKISQSGYKNLTEREKQILFEASKRL